MIFQCPYVPSSGDAFPGRDLGARAHPAELLDEFAPESQTSTWGFRTVSRASALLVPGWLHAGVIAAIAHQSAAVLAAEIVAPERPVWAPPLPVSAHRQD